MKDLSDQELKEIVARGEEAKSILNKRYGERLTKPLMERLDREIKRERRQIYKKIKGQGIYAEWHKFDSSDKMRFEELLEEGLIFETKDKRGRPIFRATDKPYPKD
jgi:hypothetical protein